MFIETYLNGAKCGAATAMEGRRFRVNCVLVGAASVAGRFRSVSVVWSGPEFALFLVLPTYVIGVTPSARTVRPLARANCVPAPHWARKV